jgi:hypothetical protein
MFLEHPSVSNSRIQISPAINRQSIITGSVYSIVWSSWSHFAYSEMNIPILQHNEITSLVADKIDHAGMLFGIPSNPPEFPDFPAALVNPSMGDYKREIAHKVLERCFARAQEEAKQRIREKIRKDGIKALIKILEGEPIFGKL